MARTNEIIHSASINDGNFHRFNILNQYL